MSSQDSIKLLTSILFDKFGKVALTPTETAQVLGRSIDGLKKDRQNGEGLPYVRLNNKPYGKPLYSINAIAKFLVEKEIKVF